MVARLSPGLARRVGAGRSTAGGRGDGSSCRALHRAGGHLLGKAIARQARLRARDASGLPRPAHATLGVSSMCAHYLGHCSGSAVEGRAEGYSTTHSHSTPMTLPILRPCDARASRESVWGVVESAARSVWRVSVTEGNSHAPFAMLGPGGVVGARVGA